MRQNVNINLINTKTVINAHIQLSHHMIIKSSKLRLPIQMGTVSAQFIKKAVLKMGEGSINTSNGGPLNNS